MYFLVEGYYRETASASYGKLVDTQAVAAPQLSGAIMRMLTRGGANLCTVVEISEEVFATFYQEKKVRGD